MGPCSAYRLMPCRSSRLMGRIAAVGAAVAAIAGGADLLAGGGWPFRVGLAAAAVVTAVGVKRRSVFRERPQPSESDLLVMGFKTVLMILGAALLATVLLQAAVEQPQAPDLAAGSGRVEADS